MSKAMLSVCDVSLALVKNTHPDLRTRSAVEGCSKATYEIAK